MYIPAMVGEVDASRFKHTNDLLKGEGQIGLLMLNTDLVRRPHRRLARAGGNIQPIKCGIGRGCGQVVK